MHEELIDELLTEAGIQRSKFAPDCADLLEAAAAALAQPAAPVVPEHADIDEWGKGDPLVGKPVVMVPTQPAAPTSQVERWNIERDGDALMVCFNDHEKGAGCRYQRFVPERPTAPAAPEGWKLVPGHPSEKMVLRGIEAQVSTLYAADDATTVEDSRWQMTRACYAAMLAAAPEPRA